MFLSDGEVALREVRREDLPLLRDWRNERELRTRTREFRPLTDEDQEIWYRRISGADRRDFMFVVEQHVPPLVQEDPHTRTRKVLRDSTQRPVGVVGICHVDFRDRTGEVSFYIGDDTAKGKGCATRALTLLHDYAFREMGLERTWAEAFAFNEASFRLLQKLGYREEGRLRRHVYRNGERWDSVMLGLLRGEWQCGSSS